MGGAYRRNRTGSAIPLSTRSAATVRYALEPAQVGMGEWPNHYEHCAVLGSSPPAVLSSLQTSYVDVKAEAISAIASHIGGVASCPFTAPFGVSSFSSFAGRSAGSKAATMVYTRSWL